MRIGILLRWFSGMTVLVAIIGMAADPPTIGSNATKSHQPNRFSQPLGAPAQSNDVIIVFDEPCPEDVQGRWLAAKNVNARQSVLFTLQIDGAPLVYPVVDWRLTSRSEATPAYTLMLLRPGEQQRVGCQSQPITGSTVASVSYKYAVVGPEYPPGGSTLPDHEDPAGFVRFILKPGLPNPKDCGSQGVPTGYWFLRNSHPRKTLKIALEGSLGHTDDPAFLIKPEEIFMVGCDTNPLVVKSVSFTH